MTFDETLREGLATLRFGFVTDIDAAAVCVRVRFPDYDDFRSAWLPVLVPKSQNDKHFALFDLDEHVAVLLDARGEDGLVLGAIYSEADRPPVQSADKHHVRFADGSTVEYDRAAHRLTVQAVGDVLVESATQITLKAPRVVIDSPDAQLTGDLSVAGKLHCAGDISSDGKIIDVGGNSNHHKH
ncbi:phage baseplate assembly protein V [Lysobacter sp. CA199]|uniref:phage baseplate assembly protein V n=1 Tax=Lysobacter sp. CA199 TaxID=3455608 RepID=UPI003F8D695E